MNELSRHGVIESHGVILIRGSQPTTGIFVVAPGNGLRQCIAFDSFLEFLAIPLRTPLDYTF
jgi:hypothetical protein